MLLGTMETFAVCFHSRKVLPLIICNHVNTVCSLKEAGKGNFVRINKGKRLLLFIYLLCFDFALEDLLKVLIYIYLVLNS